MIRRSFLLSLLLAAISCAIQKTSALKQQLIYADDFSGTALSGAWVVEQSDKDKNAVSLSNGQLQLDVKYGLTVWLKNELEGNILIEYDRTVVMAGGANDRLGDCNQFWMATGPGLETFRRTGAFNEYDALKLYYVGMGAHENTVTRIRRYNGTVDREIALNDLKKAAYLLKPNKKMHIQIWVQDGVSTFKVDGKPFFVYKDAEPYTHGLFGLRTFSSHQLIDNFKVWQLP